MINQNLVEYFCQNVDKITGNNELDDIILSGFENVSGAFLLRRKIVEGVEFSKKYHHDLTGFETFVNKIHVRDYIDTEPVTSAIMLLITALVQWPYEEELIGYVGNNETDSDASLHSTVLNFYCRRDNEIYLSKNLNDYQESAMLSLSSKQLQSNQFYR